VNAVSIIEAMDKLPDQLRDAMEGMQPA